MLACSRAAEAVIAARQTASSELIHGFCIFTCGVTFYFNLQMQDFDLRTLDIGADHAGSPSFRTVLVMTSSFREIRLGSVAREGCNDRCHCPCSLVLTEGRSMRDLRMDAGLQGRRPRCQNDNGLPREIQRRALAQPDRCAS
jgi:hypothetical protein